jgi:hypothetical protein
MMLGPKIGPSQNPYIETSVMVSSPTSTFAAVKVPGRLTDRKSGSASSNVVKAIGRIGARTGRCD